LEDFFLEVALSLECNVDDLALASWKPKLCKTVKDLTDLRNGSDWSNLNIDSMVRSRIEALLKQAVTDKKTIR
jgi:hypothetical protein